MRKFQFVIGCFICEGWEKGHGVMRPFVHPNNFLNRCIYKKKFVSRVFSNRRFRKSIEHHEILKCILGLFCSLALNFCSLSPSFPLISLYMQCH